MDVKQPAAYNRAVMLLVGDIGGTKTLVAVFSAGPGRPKPLEVRAYRTSELHNLGALVEAFLLDLSLDAGIIQSVCFGVAGPVDNRRARLTNASWTVELDSLKRPLPDVPAMLLNDLEALAWAIPVLEPDEIEIVQQGRLTPGGTVALMAAGTGLGISLLPEIQGRLVPRPSEGGHVDFAARTPDEEKLQRILIERYGRAELEHVVSGRGIANIHTLLYPHTCATLAEASDPRELPAFITRAALTQGCEDCRKILELFVSAYGAAAGNLALSAFSTGGLYIGGGIAPRILPALRWALFLDSFRSKGTMEPLMREIPVKIILNSQAVLVGAGNYLMVNT